jgi:hypothetical protein
MGDGPLLKSAGNEPRRNGDAAMSQKKELNFFTFLLPLTLLVAIALLVSGSKDSSPSIATYSMQPGNRPNQSCTVFYAADDNVALLGNNEDFTNPFTYIWFVPAAPGKYGRVYFGYDEGFPQGGVNEKGLAFDGLGLPYKEYSQPSDKPEYEGRNLFDKIMSESATVGEALTIFESYSPVGMNNFQLLVGDASGDAMIVEGENILRKEGSFQVATNFRLSENPEPPFPCARYSLAFDSLSNASSFSVELFRDILEDTHMGFFGAATLYSTIFDLKNGLIYLYYHHDFENVVVLDIAEELAKGFHYSRIASLFPPNKEAEEYLAMRTSEYEAQTTPRATSIDPGPYDDYAGEYLAGKMGDTVSIYKESERLYYQEHYSIPIELMPQTEGKYFHQFPHGLEMDVEFNRDSQDVVYGARVVLTGFGGEYAFNLERQGIDQPLEQPVAMTADSASSIPSTSAAKSGVGEIARAIPWWIWFLAILVAIVTTTSVFWLKARR